MLDLAAFSQEDYATVLELANRFRALPMSGPRRLPALQGRLVTTLFFEPSTRTRSSFELAARRLSADVQSFSPASSALAKGESLLDTARTYRLEGEGSGGVAGMAKGIADVQLLDIEGGTELAYAITAATDGPIAGFGAKMITGTARRFTERFFDALADRLGGKLEQASAG